MSNPLAALAGIAGAGFSGYEADKQRRVAEALKARQQDEEERRNKVLDVLSGASTRHLNAQSTALEAPPSKIIGQHIAPDGKAYNVMSDGSWHEASIVPAGAPPAAPPVAAPETPERPDHLPEAPRDTLPKPVAVKAAPFAKPDDLTPKDFSLGGKPVSGFVDKRGKHYDASGNPVTGEITPFVAPSFTFPQGEEGVLRGNTKTGELVATGHAAKPPILRATDKAAQARLTAAVSEMNNAHQNMAEFERRLSIGDVHISAPAQVLGRMANAFTHDDPLSQLTQSGALAALNKTDPELARYIRRGLSFAEGESMVSQRPSDFRTKMAAFLSTAASGASPEMIADIQGRRTSILNPLNATVKPSTSRTPPAVSSGATEDQRDWDAAVAKYGKAVVIKKYGPRP